MKDPLKVLIASGNTIGHVSPGIAIAEELKKENPKTEILFVTTKNTKTPKILSSHGYKCKTIRTKRLKRTNSHILFFKNIRTLAYSLKGFYDSVRIVDDFKPDIVIGTGANSSGPPLLYSSIKNIPTLTIIPYLPDLTNKILSWFVDGICISDKSSVTQFSKPVRHSLDVTGTPIREDAMKKDKESSIKYFGLDPEKRTVFITEGSQGTHYINEIFMNTLNKFTLDDKIQFILQTGLRDYNGVYEKISEEQSNVKVYPYIDEIGVAYGAADLVISRGGDTSLCEIIRNELPSILLTKHKKYQVKILVENGAAEIILKEELTSERLYHKIKEILDNPEKMNKMSEQCRELDKKNIRENIVKLIYDTIREKKSDKFPQVFSNLRNVVTSFLDGKYIVEGELNENYIQDLLQSGETFVLIRKKDHLLTLYSKGNELKTYPIGVGRAEGDKRQVYDQKTPEGIFRVKKKTDKGLTESFGRRWIGIDTSYFGFKGIGIHGTNRSETVGKNSSLGCIKMHNSDVKEIYSLLKKGDKVIITH